jgi:CubicO group peptidase (beta-lactamase class C family)
MRHSVIRRKLRRVDRALDKAIDAAEIPGAVVLAEMRRDGELLEHASVRGLAVVRPERIPMARETIFDLASLTKVLATTTAILMLTDDGAVALDDPVTKFLPHFGEMGKEGVTLRHLLTHSSGVRPWRAFHEALLERERKKGKRIIGTTAAKEWIIESICRSALVHECGTAAVYGDLDFIILGAVVEAVSHRSLDVFCQERIFRPGVGATGLCGHRELPLARSHHLGRDPRSERVGDGWGRRSRRALCSRR